jgi:hypothetical protein
VDMTKPLPADGKVSVIFGEHSTECKLSLPVASTASSAANELAQHGWLTIGNLATDSIVLQVHSIVHARYGRACLLMMIQLLHRRRPTCEPK